MFAFGGPNLGGGLLIGSGDVCSFGNLFCINGPVQMEMGAGPLLTTTVRAG